LDARTPAAAVAELKSGLQLAVSCVSPEGYRPADTPHYLSFSESVVPLRGHAGGFGLRVRVSYRIRSEGTRSWTALPAAYLYALHDEQGYEIVAYHWHPESRSPIITPHLHLGAGAKLGRAELIGGHFPTGWVELCEVLLFAIRDLGVRPLRTDWQEVLS
jgi:hypothetical protein